MDLERLTKAEYDAHLKSKTFRLAFIGMSNVGKSYRSKKLRKDSDFTWYQVDKEIIKSLGLKDMDGISEWLGFPDSKTYAEREKTYLEEEAKCTQVDFLDTNGKNLVFDTTGSLIYLKRSTIDWLQEYCLIVHLEADEEAIGAAIRQIYDETKPLVWSGFYKPKSGETQKETVARCYPKLLADRLARYRRMAHVNVPAKDLYDKSGKETIEIIRSYLA